MKILPLLALLAASAPAAESPDGETYPLSIAGIVSPDPVAPPAGGVEAALSAPACPSVPEGRSEGLGR